LRERISFFSREGENRGEGFRQAIILNRAFPAVNRRLRPAPSGDTCGARSVLPCLRRFPGRFYASLASISEAEYFEAVPEAETPPKVDFSELAAKEAKS